MVEFDKYEGKEWFKQLKENRKEFTNVDNMIESAKTKYERTNHTYEWVTGTALAIIFSLSIADVLKNQQNWIVIVGAIAYGVCLVAIVVGVWIYQIMNKRQEIALIWLYREKDKLEKKKLEK